MADDRRKLTDSEIIADQKLLMTVAEATSELPTWGSRHFAATVMHCLQNDGPDCAIDVSMCGDRGLFLLH
jgi:hypothetical protein